jgi:hypothetical protein
MDAAIPRLCLDRVLFGTVCDARHPSYSCSPIDFIRNPLIWADVLEKYKITHTAGPNFAYGLLAKRMKAVGRKLHNSTCRANIAAEPIPPRL